MSKRKKTEVVQEVQQVAAPVEVEQVARRFTPRPCSMCTALRPPNTNYSKVYSLAGKARYCKCRFCGHTWKQVGE